MSRVSIRLYTSADKGAFLRMYHRYLNEEAGIVCSENGVFELLAEILADTERYPFWIWILQVDGETAGFCIAQIDTADNFWCLQEGFGCIREFSVEPAYRRQGFGTQLAQTVERHLRQQGALQLYLTAEDGAAAAFWKVQGYHPTEQRFSRNRLLIYTKSAD